MELVANVWPVADQQTGLVLRFFVKAYALPSEDALISRTLKALAATDDLTAKLFTIPSSCREVSDFGEFPCCISIGLFHQYQFMLLEPVFREIEKGYPRLQGIRSDEALLSQVVEVPRFAQDPYLVTTTLLETVDGQLVPQLLS